MAIKKIFITGGFGYIGSKLAMEALSRGFSVFLYDSLFYGQDHKKILSEIESRKKPGATCQYVIGDTRDKALFKKTLQDFKPDFLFHFAELVGIYICDNDPKLTRSINFLGSKNAIDLGAELGIPTIYNSTSSIYGNRRGHGLLDENVPLPEPTDNYCTNKLLMEEHIHKKKRANPDFRAIILRPATVCGLSPRMRLELMSNHFTYCAIAKGVLKLSQPEAFRVWIDTNDITDSYFAIMEKEHWPKAVYNVGHHSLQKGKVAEIIQSMTGCKIELIDNLGDSRNMMLDYSAFSKDFDWRPKHSFESTIEKIKGWLEENIVEIEKSNYAGILNSPMEIWLKMI